MEKEVNKILERLSMQVISLDEARAEMRILGLFSVVPQSRVNAVSEREKHHREKYRLWQEKYGGVMNGHNIRADECKTILELLKQ